MHIVQTGKSYKSKSDYYVILKSKTGLKRDYWRHIETFQTLEEIAQYFVRIQNFYSESFINKFKYKVLLRSLICKDDVVPSQEFMLLRIKHGF